mgnify:CR=1 FL=1
MTCKDNQEFYNLIWKIVNTSEFQQMSKYKHHMQTSLYDHSIKVAYLCYKHHYKYKCKTNIEELVRAALLHDYFLYDRIDKTTSNRPRNRMVHLFKHPSIALHNATSQYDLTLKEQDAIQHHMFPIVPSPPSYACGWLICFYDKIASIGDYGNSERWKKHLLSEYPDLFPNHNKTTTLSLTEKIEIYIKQLIGPAEVEYQQFNFKG